MSQFGCVLDALNIEIICANSAPAEARVERVHQTLQDRLVKGMRLAGISDIEAANAFLPAFMTTHNDRFAFEPYNPKDAPIDRILPCPATGGQLLCRGYLRRAIVGLDAARPSLAYRADALEQGEPTAS